MGGRDEGARGLIMSCNVNPAARAAGVSAGRHGNSLPQELPSGYASVAAYLGAFGPFLAPSLLLSCVSWKHIII